MSMDQIRSDTVKGDAAHKQKQMDEVSTTING